jgi:glycosyltransferase involved in cell wall biosynthesis
MRNAVLMAVYNQNDTQLDLTKKAYDSICAQDVGDLELCIVNNGSTQPTVDWLNSLDMSNPKVHVYGAHYAKNVSPVLIINKYMAELFTRHEYILGVPNDVILPPNLYSQFLKWPRGIVTGSMTENRNFPLFDQSRAVSECTPMAVALLRKWVYDALIARDGYFLDPRYYHYASDMDFALRISTCGIRGIQLDIQYFHQCSSSWRLLPPEKGKIITDQADRDRETFERVYGFKVDDPRYGICAQDINFRGRR